MLQVVMLGSGDARYEQAMKAAEQQHSNFRCGPDLPLAPGRPAAYPWQRSCAALWRLVDIRSKLPGSA